MLKDVERYIDEYNMINPDDLVVVGVSGGADSVLLLMQLYEYQKKIPFRLKVVHVNHLIRDDAVLDAKYVSKLCEERNIPFALYEENVEEYAIKNGLSTEEAGRILRYRDFNREIEKEGCKGKIAVAHNRNDVAETVLFNLFRGTGIEGLCSLTPVNGNIIRPILGLTRVEIEHYLEINNIEHRTDSTNLGTDYARNKIRNILLPYADDNICKNSYDHIAQLSEKMRDIKEFIKIHSKAAFEKCVTVTTGGATIQISRFMELDKLLRQEVILETLDTLTSGRKDIGEVHVKSIIELIEKNGEKKLDLPYKLEALKQYDVLVIRKKVEENNREFCVEVEPDSTIVLPNRAIARVKVLGRDYTSEIIQKAYTKWFDYDKITNCLKLRNRKSGDYLTINSELSRKRLKDYLINEKIPREQRDETLVLADGDHILWVIGYRISEYYKVTDSTKRILEISIE